MIRATVETYGDAGRLLQEAKDRLARPREMMRAAAALLADSIQLNIEESRSPNGEHFQELKRVREGKSPRPSGHSQDPRPLIDTQALIDSIGWKMIDEHGTVVVAGHTGPDASLFGVPYGVYQDLGIPSANVPARTFVGVRDGDLDVIGVLVSEFVLGEFRAVVKGGPTS